MKKVSVIIPVYRGLEETIECIRTASETIPEYAHLIVINDCTPELELKEWLEKNQVKYRYELYHNKNNLGFVATVNFGMSLAIENDVLLLNSDVEVSNNWLDRMVEVAYLAEDIGSVTPFSNNATICSYPNFCQDNDLAMKKSLSLIDKVCSFANRPSDYIEIPTGVGFCMYIKRVCLDRVGLFDVETFGKGYGEENDWCQRAIKLGWKNVHATNVFVYHKGGVSFANEQSPRQKVALELLLKKHPNYTVDIMRFVAKDPGRLYRIKLAIELIRDSEKKVLQIEHSLGGGVKKHVADLVKYIEPEVASVRLSQKGNIVKLIIHDSNVLEFDVDEDFDFLIDILRYLNLSIVHFHHIHGLDERLLKLPSILTVDYFITIHDFYLVNGNPALSDCDGIFFGDNSIATIIEKSAENQLAGFKYNSVNGKGLINDFIYGAKKVIFPSHDTKVRFNQFYNVKEVSLVSYHIDDLSFLEQNREMAFSIDRLKILVIGAISLEKGARILNDFAKKYGSNVEIHLLGTSCIPLNSNIICHGEYIDSELGQKIVDIKPTVVWYTSQCAETYCYTLTPSIILDLPIIAPRLGAFTERLSRYSKSVLIDEYYSIDKVYDAFLMILDKIKNNEVNNKCGNIVHDISFYKYGYVTIIPNCKMSSIEIDLDKIEHLIIKHSHTSIIRNDEVYSLVLTLYKTRLGQLVSRLIPPRYLRLIKRKLFG
ncbi:glycosyltransferase [Vibrio cholerae]